MLNYGWMFWMLVGGMSTFISYTSSHDIHIVLLPLSATIISFVMIYLCIGNKLCALLLILVMPIILCPLLMGGRNAYQQRNSPGTFDTSTEAFAGDIEYSFQRVGELFASFSSKQAQATKKIGGKKGLSLCTGTLYVCTLVGFFGMGFQNFEPRPKKERKKK